MNATMNEGGARAEEMDNFGVVPSRYGTSPLSNHFFSVLAGPNKRDRCTSDESGTSFWFMRLRNVILFDKTALEIGVDVLIIIAIKPK